MTSLSRKERRVFEYLREQQGLPKAKPWEYQREIAARRREAALLRELVSLIGKHGFDLESVTSLLKSVTTRRDAVKTGLV
jgi:chorismate mutase